MKSLLFTLVALGTASAVACGMKNPDHSDIPTPGEVDPVAVESVEITEALTFDIGTSHTLTPTILPKNATNKDVTWTTSNSSAVSIDHNGRLNILAAGEVTITVTTDDGKKQDTCTITAVDPDAGKEYALVWAEEFGQEAAPVSPLDTGSWSVEVQSPGWVNNELQRYVNSPNNIEVSDGTLKLTCRKETSGDITSGRIHSGNKKTFTYGRFEIRAKLPGGRGIWPAIWMHGQNIGSVGWPTCGEIDIMEHVGYESTMIYASTHTQLRNHSINTQVTSGITIPDCEGEFHVYKLEWTRTSISMYVDDKKYFTYTPQSYEVGDWPFNADEMMILNVAWGGGWGGAQGVDESVLPQTMEVDYVRVYQKQ